MWLFPFSVRASTDSEEDGDGAWAGGIRRAVDNADRVVGIAPEHDGAPAAVEIESIGAAEFGHEFCEFAGAHSLAIAGLSAINDNEREVSACFIKAGGCSRMNHVGGFG